MIMWMQSEGLDLIGLVSMIDIINYHNPVGELKR
jgi:hypothetical protein